MPINFLSSRDRKKLLTQLKERFGIDDVDYFFLQAGKEKIRAFSGTLNAEELALINDFARVEFAGLYFAREEHFGYRLGFDMIHLLAPHIKKGVLELDAEQAALWMQGAPLDLDLSDGLHIIKHGDDFLGCGYSTGKRLYNYVPRERQRKKR